MSVESQKFSLKNKYFLISIGIFITYIFSFHFKFLNQFVLGTWHEKVGNDYFSIPRSFINLQFGKSIYDTSFFPFGGYATQYFYHPALSILLGSWLSLFSPQVSFYLFVFFSMGIILLSAHLLRVYLKRNGKEYLLLTCSLSTYLMLWNAQVHVFLIAAISLIISAVWDEGNGNIAAAQNKLFYGLLISLFSKPIVLMSIPYLFLLPNLRKPLWHAFVVYIIVSLVFLFVPFLNPQGDNIIHWKNIILQSSILDPNIEIYSLPWLIHRTGFLTKDLMYVFKIPVLVALLPLVKILKIEKEKLNQFVMNGFLLTTTTYFLSYTVIWEYHFVHLMPVIGYMLWSDFFKNKKIILSALVMILVPGPFGFLTNSDSTQLALVMFYFTKISKIVGVVLIYTLALLEITGLGKSLQEA